MEYFVICTAVVWSPFRNGAASAKDVILVGDRFESKYGTSSRVKKMRLEGRAWSWNTGSFLWWLVQTRMNVSQCEVSWPTYFQMFLAWRWKSWGLLVAGRGSMALCSCHCTLGKETGIWRLEVFGAGVKVQKYGARREINMGWRGAASETYKRIMTNSMTKLPEGS